MALWGKNDNLESAGTVTLNYTSKVVTGIGTTFGTVGFGTVGQVIRFGSRGSGGTYFGDAVIVEVTSATSCKIGSTEGLTGAAIGGGTQYYLSELPTYTQDDKEWSQKHDSTSGSYKDNHGAKARALATTGIGGSVIAVNTLNIDLSMGGNDALSNNGANIALAGIKTGVADAGHGTSAGVTTIFVTAPPGVAVGDFVYDGLGYGTDYGRKMISAIGSTTVTTGGGNPGISSFQAAITKGKGITFWSENIVSLKSGIAAQVTSGDDVQFTRYSGGYDRLIYGVSTTDAQLFDGSTTEYRTDGAGWVGVTTFVDCHGNLRVKKETLVAIGGDSGITTGSNGIGYPTPV